MARLTAASRAKIPTSSFALPGRRFPVHDKIHARVAKSYASRMVKRGQLSPAAKATIFAKADRRLAMQMGGVMARMKIKGKSKGYQAGGTTIGDSGRTKKTRYRMRYQNGGVAAASYDGERGQPRLRNNPNKNNFADFDGSGG